MPVTYRSVALGMLLLLAALGCGTQTTPATQLMVVVDSDLERIDAVRVLVRGLDEPKLATAEDLDVRPLPRTVAVVHEGGRYGPITVIAEAVVNDNVILSRRAELSFVRERNLMLRLDLDASCVEARCEDGMTCIAGSCGSPKVDERSLPSWTGSVPDAGHEQPIGDAGDADSGSGGGAAGSGGSEAGSGGAGSTAGEAGSVAGRAGSEAGSGGAGGPPDAGPPVCTGCSFDPGLEQPHAKLACVDDGDCELTCEAGYTDTDGKRGNGCEAQASAFPWKASNVDPNLSALKAATIDLLEVDCSATLDFGSAALAASVDICGHALQPVLLTQSNGGPEIVALAMRRLSLKNGKTLRFAGSRPVALVVYGDADIDGELDVSALGTKRGAGSDFDCTTGAGTIGARDGEDPAGGGGGGGFGTSGGRGGAARPAGALGGAGGAVVGNERLVPLRGGCPGGTGSESWLPDGTANPGGAGGGALQLSVSGRLRISGTLAAAGGGGTTGPQNDDWGDGGGGGGSGGGLLLEASRIELEMTGWITANGGGGGEGHSWLYRHDGRPGADGAHRSAKAAAGGEGFGLGGDGGTGTTPAQDAPAPSTSYAGGGGGGGGVGRIVLLSSDCRLEGGLSPAVGCAGHPD